MKSNITKMHGQQHIKKLKVNLTGGEGCTTNFYCRLMPRCHVQERISFFLERFDPIPGHGLPLRGFAIELIWNTAKGRSPLGEWSARGTDNIQLSKETNIHALDEIRTHNPSKQTMAYSRLKPRGHWDRQNNLY